MNTQGYIRGYMSKNMDTTQFINHVVEVIGKEFEEDFGEFKGWVDHIGTTYAIMLQWENQTYDIILDTAEVSKLQKQSPYKLDEYIMNIMISRGLGLDKERSQYVRYCYGIFRDSELVKGGNTWPN